MKCSTCGYQNSPARQQCIKCGASLLPAAKAAPASAVPDWRKEVTRKARAYGERKKLLTTPPHPLKERATQEEAIEPVPSSSQTTPVSVLVSSEREHQHEVDIPPIAVPEPEGHALPVEIVRQDLLDAELLEPPIESGESPSTTSVYAGRRFAALCIDSAILVVLQIVLVAVIARIVDMEMVSLAQSAWKVYLAVFIAWHFLYYLYFYRTSRQTPGQVFLGLELRDPASSEIPVSKIVIRWAAMLVLNIFNVIPLVFHRNWMVLDRFSGTEIRSMK